MRIDLSGNLIQEITDATINNELIWRKASIGDGYTANYGNYQLGFSKFHKFNIDDEILNLMIIENGGYKSDYISSSIVDNDADLNNLTQLCDFLMKGEQKA